MFAMSLLWLLLRAGGGGPGACPDLYVRPSLPEVVVVGGTRLPPDADGCVGRGLGDGGGFEFGNCVQQASNVRVEWERQGEWEGIATVDTVRSGGCSLIINVCDC